MILECGLDEKKGDAKLILSDILEKAIAIICDDDIDLTVSSTKLTKLISCGNLIYSELTEEYVQLKKSEEISFSDGIAKYTLFSESVKDIREIVKDGLKRTFRIYPSYVECDIDGDAEVVYTYHADELGLADEVVLSPQFTAAILATGVASEYFYRSGLTDEAAFYKNRYDTSVVNLTRQNKSIELKVRRFL
jgi:hypothetical protein